MCKGVCACVCVCLLLLPIKIPTFKVLPINAVVVRSVVVIKLCVCVCVHVWYYLTYVFRACSNNPCRDWMKEWEGGQPADRYVSSAQLFSISSLTFSYLDTILFAVLSTAFPLFHPLTLYPFFYISNSPLISKLIPFSSPPPPPLSFLGPAYFQPSSPGATCLTVSLFLHTISLSSSCLACTYFFLFIIWDTPSLSLFISLLKAVVYFCPFLICHCSSLPPKKDFSPFLRLVSLLFRMEELTAWFHKLLILTAI